MIEAVNEVDYPMMKEAIELLQSEADNGNPHAQSTLGLLHWTASGVPHSDAKAYLYHEFAKEGGNAQSKMALAYRYFRNQVTQHILPVNKQLLFRRNKHGKFNHMNVNFCTSTKLISIDHRKEKSLDTLGLGLVSLQI